MGGATDTFDRITILYGKNSGEVMRTHTLHQDGSLFKEVDVVAHMVPAPMPTADKRPSADRGHSSPKKVRPNNRMRVVLDAIIYLYGQMDYGRHNYKGLELLHCKF
jgi:hypothetical protein